MSEENSELAALKAQMADLKEALEASEAKRERAMDDLKKTQRELRAKSEIKPEDFSALEAENDRLKGELSKAQKEAKDYAKQAEQATKALENEQATARNEHMQAVIRGVINKAGVIPEASDAIEAFLRTGASIENVNGSYVVKRGDKLLSEFADEYFASDAAKWAKAAPVNGGGGAPGGAGGAAGKTITRAAFDALPVSEQAAIGMAAAKHEYIITD